FDPILAGGGIVPNRLQRVEDFIEEFGKTVLGAADSILQRAILINPNGIKSTGEKAPVPQLPFRSANHLDHCVNVPAIRGLTGRFPKLLKNFDRSNHVVPIGVLAAVKPDRKSTRLNSSHV